MNSLHIHVCLGPCGGDALGPALWCSRHKRLPSLTPMPWVQPHARTCTCTVSNEVNCTLFQLLIVRTFHCTRVCTWLMIRAKSTSAMHVDCSGTPALDILYGYCQLVCGHGQTPWRYKIMVILTHSILWCRSSNR